MSSFLEQIEPFRSLGFSLDAADAEQVVMSVPLAGNLNDKGTMFGGSVYSAMVLAGWTLCIEQGRAAGATGDIVVKDSNIAYLLPVAGRLTVTATGKTPPARTRRGNLAFSIQAVANDEAGNRCAEFEGSYRLLGAQKAET